MKWYRINEEELKELYEDHKFQGSKYENIQWESFLKKFKIKEIFFDKWYDR